MSFDILAAIDLRGGKVVRDALIHGIGNLAQMHQRLRAQSDDERRKIYFG